MLTANRSERSPGETALRSQAKRLFRYRSKRRPLFPKDLPLPPGRPVYAQVVSGRVEKYVKRLGYTVGELLEPDTLWLDTSPWGPDLPVSAAYPASGWTDLIRVQ